MWLLLEPRDFPSTYVKLGTIAVLIGVSAASCMERRFRVKPPAADRSLPSARNDVLLSPHFICS